MEMLPPRLAPDDVEWRTVIACGMQVAHAAVRGAERTVCGAYWAGEGAGPAKFYCPRCQDRLTIHDGGDIPNRHLLAWLPWSKCDSEYIHALTDESMGGQDGVRPGARMLCSNDYLNMEDLAGGLVYEKPDCKTCPG